MHLKCIWTVTSNGLHLTTICKGPYVYSSSAILRFGSCNSFREYLYLCTSDTYSQVAAHNVQYNALVFDCSSMEMTMLLMLIDLSQSFPTYFQLIHRLLPTMCNIFALVFDCSSMEMTMLLMLIDLSQSFPTCPLHSGTARRQSDQHLLSVAANVSQFKR